MVVRSHFGSLNTIAIPFFQRASAGSDSSVKFPTKTVDPNCSNLDPGVDILTVTHAFNLTIDSDACEDTANWVLWMIVEELSLPFHKRMNKCRFATIALLKRCAYARRPWKIGRLSIEVI